jgi:histidinol-phosphate aminotransferase
VTPEERLAHHGDVDARAGLVDLAVNVRTGTPPQWLRERLAAVEVARYPDPTEATKALAARHTRAPAEVLVTNGAAEAFTLLGRAVDAQLPVMVHPQFSEPERALVAAGKPPRHVVLREPFVLDPTQVPDDADLVFVGNPTNPTSVLHPADALRALARPGRTLVVDEAFADCVPREHESLAAAVDLPGLVVVRSLTKTWGLAGLRVGYLLAAPELIARLAAAQPHWAANALALEACVACSEPRATAEAAQWAADLATERAFLADALSAIPGVHVVAGAAAPFLLVRTPLPDVWLPLRDRGYAVRRGDTFPGLGPDWIRVAVRTRDVSMAFAATLAATVQECS